LPPTEDLDWLLAAYEWLLEVAPGSRMLLAAPALRPTEADFPVGSADVDTFAAQLFDVVKDHAAMGQWPCELVLLEDQERPERLMGLAAGATSHTDTNGLFSMMDGESAVIAVRIALASEWESMVAVLAHELAHYRLAQVEGLPPGGAARLEAVTDLCAVAMGFGLFLTNSAVRAQGWSDGAVAGWSIAGTAEGYLDERTLAVAVALFADLTEADPDLIRGTLAPTPRRSFDVARRWLAEHHPGWGAALRERYGGPLRR
jgi:hypothetical protein